jgi:hypothetical protein
MRRPWWCAPAAIHGSIDDTAEKDAGRTRRLAAAKTASDACLYWRKTLELLGLNAAGLGYKFGCSFHSRRRTNLCETAGVFLLDRSWERAETSTIPFTTWEPKEPMNAKTIATRVSLSAIAAVAPLISFGHASVLAAESTGVTATAAPSAIEWAQPKVTLSPLTNIQTVYDEIKTESSSAGSFRVSADGKHYAAIKRTGIKTWTMLLDGKAGPEFASIQRFNVNSDFTSVFYLATEPATGKAVFVTQIKDKLQKFDSSQSSDGWELVRDLSMEHVRLIEKRRTSTGKELRLDGKSTFGPYFTFNLIFDPYHNHYLLLVSKAKGRPATLDLFGYLDGTECLSAPGMVPLSDADTVLRTDGRYATVISSGGGRGAGGGQPQTLLILNGKVLGPFSGHPYKLRLSPDGEHVACLNPSSANEQALLVDGVEKARFQEFSRFAFTGDSRSVGYTASHQGTNLIGFDNQPPTKDEYAGGNTLFGLHAGEVTQLFNDNTIVRNGQRFPGPRSDFNFKWTPDGKHLFLSVDRTVYVDSSSADLFDHRPYNSIQALDPIWIDASHASQVIKASTEPGGTIQFLRADIELVPTTAPSPKAAR